MEIPNSGHDTPHPLRQRLVGCPYTGTDSCPGAWDQYSPNHNCCTQGNVDAATPLLMFNSRNELIDRKEPDDMFDLVDDTTIPVSKVILDNAGHAFYEEWIIDYDRPTNPDRVHTSNDPLLPNFDGLNVQEATAEYLLAQLT